MPVRSSACLLADPRGSPTGVVLGADQRPHLDDVVSTLVVPGTETDLFPWSTQIPLLSQGRARSARVHRARSAADRPPETANRLCHARPLRARLSDDEPVASGEPTEYEGSRRHRPMERNHDEVTIIGADKHGTRHRDSIGRRWPPDSTTSNRSPRSRHPPTESPHPVNRRCANGNDGDRCPGDRVGQGRQDAGRDAGTGRAWSGPGGALTTDVRRHLHQRCLCPDQGADPSGGVTTRV